MRYNFFIYSLILAFSLNAVELDGFLLLERDFCPVLKVVKPNSSSYGNSSYKSNTSGSQYLVITSVPEGADVSIDGIKQGKTPFHKLYQVGEHIQYRVSHPRYLDAIGQIEITADQAPINITLSPASAKLTVKSLPNAIIYVDGKEMGRGSATWTQDAGICEVAVSLSGHSEVKKTITVHAGIDQTIEINPTPIYGTLIVESNPIGAEIWLDGENLGLTPRVLSNVTATEHELTLRKQGATKYVSKVNVLPSKETTLSVQLQIGLKPIDLSVKGVTFRMMPVEGGTFTMGVNPGETGPKDPNSLTPHQVTLSDYYIGETEVTQALWRAVMDSNPSYFKGSSQLPVDQVSWEACQEFITKLNKLTGMRFRLPSEAEWEFAALGGNKSMNYKYPGSSTIGNVSWYEENSQKKPHIVNSKQSNELGLYNMAGNLKEWCMDNYMVFSSEAVTNPMPYREDKGIKVLRGGSWDSSELSCRVWYRDCREYNFYNGETGLRLVLIP